jgi:hypothetical protein
MRRRRKVGRGSTRERCEGPFRRLRRRAGARSWARAWDTGRALGVPGRFTDRGGRRRSRPG